jgi:peptide deformylase
MLSYPDPRLRQPATPVTAFDETLQALAADLLDTLRHAQALGITAPHIGVPLRLVVIQLGEEASVRFYANPHIAFASAETARHEEGSVCMPGFTETLERPARIHVAYQDLCGEPHAEDAEGMLAACHQHEIDQLDGIFWIDRLSRLKRERLLKRYSKR